MKYYHGNYYLYADKDEVALKPLIHTPGYNGRSIWTRCSIIIIIIDNFFDIGDPGSFKSLYTPKDEKFQLVNEAMLYIVLIFEEGKETFVIPRTKVFYHCSIINNE